MPAHNRRRRAGRAAREKRQGPDYGVGNVVSCSEFDAKGVPRLRDREGRHRPCPIIIYIIIIYIIIICITIIIYIIILLNKGGSTRVEGAANAPPDPCSHGTGAHARTAI